MLIFRIGIGLLFSLIVYLEGNSVHSHPTIESLKGSFIKIEDALLETFATPGSARGVFVSLKGGIQNVLTKFSKSSYPSRDVKLISLHSQLVSNAQNAQRNIIDFLKSRNIEYKSFWISNQIYLPQVGLDVLQNLISTFDEILEIREEEILNVLEFQIHESTVTPLAEWGIDIIQAPEAWGLDGGNNGFNAVVASIGTGVRGTHEALSGNYLDNGYSWFDPYDFTEIPNDENGVGTHTTGTTVGSNGIGVAPGARWMACAGCTASGSCTQSALISCGEFILCPHDFTGSNNDCTKAPHLVNNIWGGAQGSTSFHSMIEAWVAGGIIPVFANGGSGPACGSSGSPGDHPLAISVSSSSRSDALSSSSSLGPGFNSTIKPDLIAPGENIRSAFTGSDTTYIELSGSSISSPHVAGTIALLVSRKPSLTLEEAKAHLAEGAVKEGLTLPGLNCGGVSETTFPNNACGHGRVSALASLFSLIISG